MRADEVARYLLDNPGFFNEHADLLDRVLIPHPHGGRAISITERQILTLRERVKKLEGKLAELIRFGEENDAIGEKVHRLALALLAAPGADAVAAEIREHLREDFEVPEVALRVWAAGPGCAREASLPVEEAARGLVESLARPACGPAAGNPAAAWFGEGARVRSMALVPLRRGAAVVGALALGSEEPERFYPEMGTLFLNRIGELIAMALAREPG